MAVRGGEEFARRVGGDIMERLHPGYIPPEVLAQQRMLKKFEGRLGVVGNLIDPDEDLKDDDELEARASSTAQALVDVGVADQGTAIELRPLVPEEATVDPLLNSRRQKAVMFLRHTLAHDHDITSIATPNPPIMPSKRRDSPIDIAATWGAITSELSLLTEQVRDRFNRRPAMLAIAGTPYSQAVLEAQPGQRERVDHYGLLVLQRVGTLPEDNLLVPAASG
jgi:hypothetical protein